MSLKVMVDAPPPSKIIISLTSIWLLMHSLEIINIPTEITMAKSGHWLLTLTCIDTANTFWVHWDFRIKSGNQNADLSNMVRF